MIQPKLKTLSPNLTEVSIGLIDYYFSYETCVAARLPGMGLVVSQNVWSKTTGKHLNTIDGGSADAKAKRQPSGTFDAILAGL